MILSLIILIFLCILLIVLILIQNPRMGGIHNTISIYGNRIFGIQKNTDFFEKITWIVTIITFSVILLINYVIKHMT